MFDLLWLLVTHNISHEFSVENNMVVRVRTSNEFVEELAEVVTNRQINEHLLVERCIILTIDGLDVLELGEVAQGVSLAHNLLDRATVLLQCFDHVDDVLELVTVKHTSEELVERVGALADHVGNLSHQLLLHVHAKKLCIKLLIGLVSKDRATIVGLLHDDTELSHVLVALQTAIDIFTEESLAKCADLRLRDRIVDVSKHHLSYTKLPHGAAEVFLF